MKLIECPRDAMQGMEHFIPVGLKADYLNILLEIGFDTLDFGSFVSPSAVPQMKDTAEVLGKLDLSTTHTKLLAIVANTRGARQAAEYDQISYIGFPFSISETFQKRNTNSNIADSLITVEEILALCQKNNKTAVVYMSMAFGNPYGDEWNYELVASYTNQLVKRGCKIISLADTVGLSTEIDIKEILPGLINHFGDIEFGVHLHSAPDTWNNKVNAAFESGCRRFDSALRGYGGCPMASDKLVGNIATENLVGYLQSKGIELNLNYEKLNEAMEFSNRIFNTPAR